MKSNYFGNKKLKLLLVLMFVGLCFHVRLSAQSVYVGKAGPEGKVLRQYIDPAALKRLVDHPADSIWVVDVRSEKAFINGHIPGAKSFPVGEIMQRLNEIPKDQYLILYCTIGGNARLVQKKLKKAGYLRTMDWGGLSRWPWTHETGKYQSTRK